MEIAEWTRRSMAVVGLVFIAIALASCNLPSTQTAPTATPEAALTATDTPPPTLAPTATATPRPAFMALIGPVETVFDWTTERCELEDIPDLPARALRDAEENVQLYSSHLETRRFLGPELDDISRDCTIVMNSSHDPDPAQFNDNEWIGATYTEDGQRIYALLHQEYHGWEHGDDCASIEHFNCWYNSLTMAVSDDGGTSFQDLADPPDHLAAALPDRYQEGAGPNGIFEPSNIIKKDGHYYAYIRIDRTGSGEQRICLMRTDDLDRPDAWRAWDGEGFNVTFANPYQMAAEDLGGVPCSAIDPESLGVMNQSISYNTFLERYLMIGVTAIHLDGREVWGVLYATSDDLIEWDDRKLLFEVELPWTYEPGDDVYMLYPSLLDPASPSRNFDVSGKTGYIYFTRFNQPGVAPLDRDLVRVPVELFDTAAEAEAAKQPFVIQP